MKVIRAWDGMVLDFRAILAMQPMEYHVYHGSVECGEFDIEWLKKESLSLKPCCEDNPDAITISIGDPVRPTGRSF